MNGSVARVFLGRFRRAGDVGEDFLRMSIREDELDGDCPVQALHFVDLLGFAVAGFRFKLAVFDGLFRVAAFFVRIEAEDSRLKGEIGAGSRRQPGGIGRVLIGGAASRFDLGFRDQNKAAVLSELIDERDFNDGAGRVRPLHANERDFLSLEFREVNRLWAVIGAGMFARASRKYQPAERDSSCRGKKRQPLECHS